MLILNYESNLITHKITNVRIIKNPINSDKSYNKKATST